MKTKSTLLITLLLMLGMFTGCASSSNILEKLPSYSFEDFSYRGSSNFTKTDIRATNAVREDGLVKYDEVAISHHNSLGNVDLTIKGLSKKVQGDE